MILQELPTAVRLVAETSTKDLGRNPATIGRVDLQEAGLHRARVWGSHLAARHWLSEPLLEEGAVVLRDVFDDVEAVRREIESVPVLSHKRTPGNLVGDRPALRALAAVVFESLFVHAFRFQGPDFVTTVRRYFESGMFVQRLAMRPGDQDEQKVLHSDTFFPALKFWYFPDDVDASGGAFSYALGSSAPTEARMTWRQEQALRVVRGEPIEPWRGRGHREGSFRISPEELLALGARATPIEVPANSLVIANVHGFHRRGEPSGAVERRSLHGSIRFARPFQVPPA